MTRIRFVGPLLVLLSTGCLSTVIPDHTPGPDNATLLAMLGSGSYRQSGFQLVNRTPYKSALAPTNLISVYVSSEAADAYMAIDPESSNEGTPFPVGGVIIREVWDGAGKEMVKVTVMQKQPAGYYADAGDFLFGVTDPQGHPAMNGGTPTWGPETQCGSCHQQKRSQTGYLFGVPADNRN
jgi:hypothetical protein